MIDKTTPLRWIKKYTFLYTSVPQSKSGPTTAADITIFDVFRFRFTLDLDLDLDSVV